MFDVCSMQGQGQGQGQVGAAMEAPCQSARIAAAAAACYKNVTINTQMPRRTLVLSAYWL